MNDVEIKQAKDTSVATTGRTLSGRRQVLNTSAIGAAAALLGAVAAACSDDDDNDSGPGNGSAGESSGGEPSAAGAGPGSEGGASGTGGEAGAPSVDPDVAQLNALLTAEYNAITAYTAGAKIIMGAPASDALYALRDVIVAVAVSIQSDHRIHAQALVDAIGELSGTPVVEADVAAKFAPPKGLSDNPTITNVLKFAASAERGAAVAYNQVLSAMQDAKYRFLAGAIEGDETQHFIVLTALVLGLADPGPNLSVMTAENVIPDSFVSTVNTVSGLDKTPVDYYP